MSVMEAYWSSSQLAGRAYHPPGQWNDKWSSADRYIDRGRGTERCMTSPRRHARRKWPTAQRTDRLSLVETVLAAMTAAGRLCGHLFAFTNQWDGLFPCQGRINQGNYRDPHAAKSIRSNPPYLWSVLVTDRRSISYCMFVPRANLPLNLQTDRCHSKADRAFGSSNRCNDKNFSGFG
jgi:hypothetical protein